MKAIPNTALTDPARDPSLAQTLAPIRSALGEEGFCYRRAPLMDPLLRHFGARDWESFAASWDRLGLDRYMADGGRYRRRRYGTFSLSPAGISRKRHQPHYQSRDYNVLNGGIERWFRAIEDNVGEHPAMIASLRLFGSLAYALTLPEERPDSWHAEVHQFRIEARADMLGSPTPEGMHRDGVDWVMVMMVARENVRSGVTSIHDIHRAPVGSFTLEEPMDTAFVDDHRVYHGVTGVEPVDPARPAHRDVLVVTLRHE